MKIGVGEKPANYDLADYVLGHFTQDERKVMNDAAGKACEAIRMMVTGEADAAMNQFNRKNS